MEAKGHHDYGHTEELLYRFPGQHIYEGMVFSAAFPKESLDKVKSFKLYPEDIMLVTPLKSGTVWAAEIIWLISNNADTGRAKQLTRRQRIPGLEAVFPEFEESNIDFLKQKSAGRLFSTHLQSTFFRPQLEIVAPKVIVLFRNPKDVLVSFYHFYRASPNLGNFKGTWSDFFEMFLAKELHHGDFFDMVTSWWKFKDAANFLFLKYEDIKMNPNKYIKDIAKFLGRTLTNHQIETIVTHTSFDAMKINPMVQPSPAHNKAHISPYLRKGMIGDWKNYFTVSQSQILDDICEERLAGSGLEFTYA